MTVDVSNEPAASPAIADAETARVAPPRRSVWRASLGGVLIFAAGAMVGFAPMRAWVSFRDEPDQVQISAIVLEADAKDVVGLREALKTQRAEEKTGNPDPLAALQSLPGTKVLARPRMWTAIGEKTRFLSGGELVVPDEKGGVRKRRFGIETTLEPQVRTSGSFNLNYRITYLAAPTGLEIETPDGRDLGGIVSFDESIESNVVVRPHLWEPIEWRGESRFDEPDRVRWIFVKIEPAD